MESYTLYILLRNDLDSMTPGRMAAQAAHGQAIVSNIAHFDFTNRHCENKELNAGYKSWCNNSDFGRTIILTGSIDNIRNAFSDIYHHEDMDGIRESIYDPSYMIKDGSEVFNVGLTHTGYVVLRKTMKKEDQPESMQLLQSL